MTRRERARSKRLHARSEFSACWIRLAEGMKSESWWFCQCSTRLCQALTHIYKRFTLYLEFLFFLLSIRHTTSSVCTPLCYCAQLHNVIIAAMRPKLPDLSPPITLIWLLSWSSADCCVYRIYRPQPICRASRTSTISSANRQTMAKDMHTTSRCTMSRRNQSSIHRLDSSFQRYAHYKSLYHV